MTVTKIAPPDGVWFGSELEARGVSGYDEGDELPEEYRELVTQVVMVQATLARSAHQLLDASCSSIEALGELRHLVVSLDLDARRKLAGTQRFDSRLQALQARSQPPHHRIGADTDRERKKRQYEEQPVRRMPVTARRPRLKPPTAQAGPPQR